MSTPLILSHRDLRVIDALSSRVRMFTLSQVSRAYFADDDRYTRRRIRRLVDARLVTGQSLVARRTPPLEAPLLRWEPGESTPSSDKVSAALISRWTRQRSAATDVIVLGPAAARLSGTGRRTGIKHPLQVAHDLALSEVYLRYLSRAPELASRWLGEDSLCLTGSVARSAGQVMPDAAIIDSDGQPELAIELGGLYSPGRITALHQSFSRRGLSYEIW